MSKQTEDFEKDIVSFDQAIELATLGFDKQTLCGYDIADRQLYLCQVDEDGIYMPQKDLAAPTKGQVFRWFREKYNLSPNIWSGKINHIFYGYDILHIKKQKFVINNTDLGGGDCDYETYEEAENACISKLLELAKQQDK